MHFTSVLGVPSFQGYLQQRCEAVLKISRVCWHNLLSGPLDPEGVLMCDRTQRIKAETACKLIGSLCPSSGFGCATQLRCWQAWESCEC